MALRGKQIAGAAQTASDEARFARARQRAVGRANAAGSDVVAAPGRRRLYDTGRSSIWMPNSNGLFGPGNGGI